ncbi:hypothetical protein ACFLQ2_02700 [archaeon]
MGVGVGSGVGIGVAIGTIVTTGMGGRGVGIGCGVGVARNWFTVPIIWLPYIGHTINADPATKNSKRIKINQFCTFTRTSSYIGFGLDIQLY